MPNDALCYRLQYIADGDVQLVFVLANDCESKVAKENAAHQDIIFVDVRESYFTLTPKVRPITPLRAHVIDITMRGC